MLNCQGSGHVTTDCKYQKRNKSMNEIVVMAVHDQLVKKNIKNKKGEQVNNTNEKGMI